MKGQPSTHLPSTQEHILAQSVRDSVVVLQTAEMAALVEVEGVDVTRLSDDARAGLAAQYENFLLTLRFKYQILVARKRQRLEEYLAYVEAQAQARGQAGNPAHARALYTWITFMTDVARQVNPQAPLYLFVLPYDPIPSEERARRFALTPAHYARGLDELARRADQVVRGLSRVGLNCQRLNDTEIVAALHRVYHPSIPDYRVPPTARVKILIAQSTVVG